MRIAIAGAGIGGLLTALSLEAAGFDDIGVYERSAEIRGLGVGINLLPHAVRELTELGIVDDIAAHAVRPTSLAYFNAFGQSIWSEPRGTAAGYRWPQLSVHRGRLQLVLRDLVRERLGEVIRTDHRLVDVRSGADAAGRALARFATGRGAQEVAADVVIGADGIHSALRAQHYPAEGAPPSNGLTLWRGVARAAPFLDGRTMIMAGDGGLKFVAYPLGPVEADGRMPINFIAERREAGGASRAAEWNRAVPVEPIAERFADWRFDWLDVPALIRSADEILEYPMVDRDALPRWTFGNATLLGDAAHAMYPNGSNGASQAVLDARTLAHRLATAATPEEGLAAYEAERRPATTALHAQTRGTGPERVMLLAAERAPQGFAHIHEVIAPEELEDIAAGYKRAAGFHAESLNARSSLTVRG
ncbi:flavin-dependent oxidoreductase [Leucobacter allii]|uniref:flavin-dependent oxidoreductase n=1 Tax=Leucobacter allii TaxID=2932247 RepID=UPI001FD3EEAD|nr:flavin-dependent oxidoreductase [Leucobacter allii]UOR02768.1 flavin-dependent oxidoreductase [Leucobacter allii]